MSDEFPRNFKIITLLKTTLPAHNLNDAIISCSDFNEFETASIQNRSSDLTFACTYDEYLDIATSPTLKNLIPDTIYILTDQNDIMWGFELERSNCESIKIREEKSLMRHLCTKAMLYYYKQGITHKTNGNCGLAHLCFGDALKALEQSKEFI